MKSQKNQLQKDYIFEQEFSQRESSYSSDSYQPDSIETDNTRKYTKTKNIQKKRPTRHIGKGERKDKNTFPNTLQKLYRISLQKLGFESIIQAGKMGNEVTVDFVKNKKTIFVSLPKKCAKNQLMKFLALIAKNFTEVERRKIKAAFTESVEKSIKTQQNKMNKNQNYRQSCEESINTLKLIKELIQEFLKSSTVVLNEDLNKRTFNKETKKEKYNNGIKSIQKHKLYLLVKELQKMSVESSQNNEGNTIIGRNEADIIIQDNWLDRENEISSFNYDYFDVLDLERRRSILFGCSFDE